MSLASIHAGGVHPWQRHLADDGDVCVRRHRPACLEDGWRYDHAVHVDGCRRSVDGRQHRLRLRPGDLPIEQIGGGGSSLVDLRARYYDPATAQFLTVDPPLDKTHSPYGYVGSNPLNDSDPTGMCGLWCKVGIGVVVGAVVVKTVACVIAEPCGLVEAGAAVAGGGLAFGDGFAIAVPAGIGTAIGYGASIDAVTGLVWNAASGSGGSGSSGGGSGGGSSGPPNSGVNAKPLSQTPGSSGCEDVARAIQQRIGGSPRVRREGRLCL